VKANIVSEITTGDREDRIKSEEDFRREELEFKQHLEQEIRQWEENGLTKEVRSYLKRKREENRDKLATLKVEDLYLTQAKELVYKEILNQIEELTTV